MYASMADRMETGELQRFHELKMAEPLGGLFGKPCVEFCLPLLRPPSVYTFINEGGNVYCV